jgi:hypothetical protein
MGSVSRLYNQGKSCRVSELGNTVGRRRRRQSRSRRRRRRSV